MRHSPCFERERPDVRRPLGQRLDVERDPGEAGLGVEGVDTSLQAGRADDPDAAARRLPAQVVAEGDKVDEVVGVEVADDDGLELGRIDQPGQPREGALPEVEHEIRPCVTQQVRGPRGAWPIRVRRSGADDIKPHRPTGDPAGRCDRVRPARVPSSPFGGFDGLGPPPEFVDLPGLPGSACRLDPATGSLTAGCPDGGSLAPG